MFTLLYRYADPSQAQQLHHAILSAPWLRFVQPRAGTLYAVLKFGIARGSTVELQTANAHCCTEEISILDWRPWYRAVRPVSCFALCCHKVMQKRIDGSRRRQPRRAKLQH